MLKLEGRLERFLGLYCSLLRTNRVFVHPYLQEHTYDIYYPSASYRTTRPGTRCTFPSQLNSYAPGNRRFSAIDRLVKSFRVEEAVQVEEAVRVEALRV